MDLSHFEVPEPLVIGWEDRTEDRLRRDRESYRGLLWQAQHQKLLFEGPDDMETVITCEGGYCSD